MMRDLVKGNIVPVQFYLKSGNRLEVYGVEEKKSFKTHYFIECSNYPQEDCLHLILLIPIQLGDQIFLKRTDNILIINKNCLLSRQELDKDCVVSDAFYVYNLLDFFKGKFKIPDGFCETLIWETNLENESKCKVCLTYDKGVEDSIEVYTFCDNKEESFELKKSFSLILELKQCTKIMCKRKDKKCGPVQGEFHLTFENELFYKP